MKSGRCVVAIGFGAGDAMLASLARLPCELNLRPLSQFSSQGAPTEQNRTVRSPDATMRNPGSDLLDLDQRNDIDPS
jgi:hypothetical protein